MFRFFFGPRLSDKEQVEMMETRLKRLQATANQKQLELERQQSKFILIASLSDLNTTQGKYFIDYDMRPALAFRGKDGLPVLLSAKCTHLGCTVGNEVNDQGKILCPCHVSFFDVGSGVPDADAPAKAPLPKLPWVLMDSKGTVIASCTDKGVVSGNTNPAAVKGTNVYVARSNQEMVS
jgi:Rieske Fe-S protein